MKTNIIGKISIFIVLFLILMIGFFSLSTNNISYASADVSDLHTAEVIYNYLNFKNGEIRYTIQAWVNEDYIVSRVANSEAPQLIESINTELTGLKEYFLEEGFVSTYDEDECLFEVVLASYPSRHRMAVSDPNENGYEAYDPLEDLVEWGFYKSIYSSSSEPVFKDIEDTYIQTVVNALLNIQQITANNLTYIYNFGTSVSTKTIQSNANEIYYNSNYELYIHEFVMNQDSIADSSIILTQMVYNSLGWNVTLIIGSIIALIGFYFLMRKIEKRRTKQKIELDN